MNEGDKVCLSTDRAGLDRGTIIQRFSIHKVRILWEDGEETIEEDENVRRL